MQRLWRNVERALEAIMAIFLLSMALITVIDVVGRYLLNAPLTGGYEIVQYLMALSVFASLPLATRAENHLTVSLVTDQLTGWARRGHRIVILIVSALSLAFITWRLAEQAAALASRGTLSGSLGLPLAPIAWTMTVLAGLAVLVACALLARAIFDPDADTGPTAKREPVE